MTSIHPTFLLINYLRQSMNLCNSWVIMSLLVGKLISIDTHKSSHLRWKIFKDLSISFWQYFGWWIIKYSQVLVMNTSGIKYSQIWVWNFDIKILVDQSLSYPQIHLCSALELSIHNNSHLLTIYTYCFSFINHLYIPLFIYKPFIHTAFHL